MATKRTNAQTQPQSSEPTQRLGVTIDAQTHLLISTMAAFRGCTPAEILTDAAWSYIGQWQSRERDSILAVIRARFGRLKRSCGPSASENAVEPAGQGESLASGSPAMPDALQARTDAISARFKQTTAPLDAALSALAGGD